MKWTKTAKTVNAFGETTIRYRSTIGEVAVESRKVRIAHANNRSGYWMHTTYFVIRPDGSEEEHWTLARAKEAAERIEGERRAAEPSHTNDRARTAHGDAHGDCPYG